MMEYRTLKCRAVCLLFACLFVVVLNACLGKPKRDSVPLPDKIIAQIQGRRDAAIYAIWYQLNITSDLFKDANKHTYAVERFDVEINGDDGLDAILRISQGLDSWDWQYLFFSKRAGRWDFLGNLDFGTQKSGAPKHRIINMGGKAIWLAIKSSVITGTGVSLHEEAWYKVSEKKLREVLRYPTEGYIVGWGIPFSREFSGKILKEGMEDGIATVEAEFIASYFNYGFYDDEDLVPLHKLFSVKQRVRYVWEQSSERFVVDSSKSQLSQEEIDGIFNDGKEEFLKHRFDQLLQVAITGSKLHKRWLRRFLEDCEDSSWKEAILERLHPTSGEVDG